MHPREALRREITDTIRAALPASAFVASSLARDIPSGASLTAVVYTSSETISPVSSNGEARTGVPVRRSMSVSIVVVATDSGTGETAMAAADDASRLIELALSSSFSNLRFDGVNCGVSSAERTGAQVEMSYTATYTDSMQHGE